MLMSSVLTRDVYGLRLVLDKTSKQVLKAAILIIVRCSLKSYHTTSRMLHLIMIMTIMIFSRCLVSSLYGLKSVVGFCSFCH